MSRMLCGIRVTSSYQSLACRPPPCSCPSCHVHATPESSVYRVHEDARPPEPSASAPTIGQQVVHKGQHSVRMQHSSCMATPVPSSAATGTVLPTIGQALYSTSTAPPGVAVPLAPDDGDPDLSASSRSLSAATRAVAELMSSSPRVDGAVGVFCVT